jgi:hypothetical protein
MTSENLVTDEVDTVGQDTAAPAQEETKMFRQEDVDKIVAERVQRERAKFEKKYSDVNLDEYRSMVADRERKELEAKKQRGEFEKILEETVGKKDGVIQDLQKQIHSIKVEGALLNAASSKRAVNPKQVTQLLQSSVKLTETGEVEVLDESGSPRYNDAGKLLSVDEYVSEWLTANPHFVASTPGGSGSSNNVAANNTGDKIDISKLDMTRRSDREIYAKYRAERDAAR